MHLDCMFLSLCTCCHFVEFDTDIIFLGAKKEKANRSADGSHIADQNFMLKTGIFSMFYELGWDVLKAARVVIIGLREVKYLLKELLDLEMSQPVILRAIVTRLKKMEESPSKTEEALEPKLEELPLVKKQH